MSTIVPQHHDLSGVVLIALNRGLFALIDEADASVLEGYSWVAFQPRKSRSFYVSGRRVVDGVHEQALLHRLIMLPDAGLEVDHVNGNGLDCRRSNLRIVTHAENAKNLPVSSQNTSGVPGVSWDRHRNKWRAHIRHQGKALSLGRFDTKEAAIQARKDAEARLVGEFARKDAHL